MRWKKWSLKDLKSGLKDITQSIANATNTIVFKPFVFVGNAIGGWAGNLLANIGNIGIGLNNYFTNSMNSIMGGIISGNVNEIKEGLVGLGNIAIGALAAFSAIATGQFWALAFVTGYFDNLVNNGGLTDTVVSGLGDAENSLFGSNHINDHKEEINAALSAISNIGTFFFATLGLQGLLAPIISSTPYLPSILNGISIANGIYQGWATYNYIKEKEKEYEQAYQEYLASLKRWDQLRARAEKLFFNIITGTNMYRYFAGGDIYNSTSPGAYYFSPLTINEPYATILQYIKLDDEKHKMSNTYAMGRIYDDLAGSHLFLKTINPYIK